MKCDTSSEMVNGYIGILVNDNTFIDEFVHDETINYDFELESDSTTKLFYKNNKFYIEYNELYETIVSLSSDYGCDNMYYNIPFILYFLKQYIPFLLMWANSIKCIVQNKKVSSNYTNAPVESFFGELKHNLEKNACRIGKTPIKVGRFYQILNDLTKEKSFFILEDLPRNITVNKSNKIENKKKELSIEFEEKWRHKTNKKSMKHFSNSRKKKFKFAIHFKYECF